MYVAELTDKQARVFEILRKHGALSVTGIAKVVDPDTKPDHILTSNIAYALKGLEANGLIKLNRQKRPFTAEVVPEGLKEYVADAIHALAGEFFHGEVDALVHFIDTNLGGGKRAKTKTSGAPK